MLLLIEQIFKQIYIDLQFVFHFQLVRSFLFFLFELLVKLKHIVFIKVLFVLECLDSLLFHCIHLLLEIEIITSASSIHLCLKLVFDFFDLQFLLTFLSVNLIELIDVHFSQTF